MGEVHIGAEEPSQLVGQHGRRRIAHAGKARRIGQVKHLVIGSFGQFLASIADIDIPQSRKTIEKLFALGCMQPDSLRLMNHKRIFGGRGMVQRVQLALVLFNQCGVIVIIHLSQLSSR